MNQRSAFTATIGLAINRNMPSGPGPLSLTHLISMNERITPDFSEAKLGRWLGWAQCAVVAAGCATLEEMKELNKRHSS